MPPLRCCLKGVLPMLPGKNAFTQHSSLEAFSGSFDSLSLLPSLGLAQDDSKRGQRTQKNVLDTREPIVETYHEWIITQVVRRHGSWEYPILC